MYKKVSSKTISFLIKVFCDEFMKDIKGEYKREDMIESLNKFLYDHSQHALLSCIFNSHKNKEDMLKLIDKFTESIKEIVERDFAELTRTKTMLDVLGKLSDEQE